MEFDKIWIKQWIDKINTDAGAKISGASFNDSCSFQFDDKKYCFVIRNGAVEELIENPGTLIESTFTLSASKEVWTELFSPNPSAMNHDIFAAIAMENMTFEGNVKLLFQQLITLSHWISAGRSIQGESILAPEPEFYDDWQSVGRYVNVEVNGKRHKVFYFEAGQGVPVICQHTAGNENRQWRHLLEDRELTKKFKFIAYDLPAHGKSDPSVDGDFFSQEQLLRSDWVTDFVVAFMKKLRLEKPIFIGCSIGGVVALHLAERHPDLFKGLISLAASVPTYGFFHDWWIHPEVNTNLMVTPGLMDSVMPPDISKSDRQINRIIQSASPKTLRSDLYFWGEENSDAERAKRIDGKKCPLYMYAGEYDFTCPPEHVEKSARSIGNVTYKTLGGLGHFPMSESYDRFRPILIETLDEILRRS